MEGLERRIYSPWAFTENEFEKGRMNHDIYNELKSKYIIFRSDFKNKIIDGFDICFDDYDIVIGRKPGYHHSVYYVYKNAPKLSVAELALICDGGNLCFGHRLESNQDGLMIIRVSED